jgi:hypothetical protein
VGLSAYWAPIFPKTEKTKAIPPKPKPTKQIPLSFVVVVMLGMKLSSGYTLSVKATFNLTCPPTEIGAPNYLPRLALNSILLISASWVPRITGVSHQRPAHSFFLLINNLIGGTGVWTQLQGLHWATLLATWYESHFYSIFSIFL